MPVLNAATLLFATQLSGVPQPNRTPAVGGQVHVVHMIGYTYEPADLIVRPGDTIRFVQESTLPHNVEFTDVPAGATLGEAMSGPYLIKSGDAYDLVISKGFTAGNYVFHCTPHQAMGMKGTIRIQ